MSRLLSPNRVLLIGLLLVGLIVSSRVAQATSLGLIITEVMAANTSTVADDRGSYSDWIELHNPTDMPVSLAGYTLTDDPAAPAKWSLPVTTLAPGAFLVIWASGLDQVTAEGWHTSFRLSRSGDYVGLFDPDGQLVDAVTFEERQTDVSLGRLGTVSDQWMAFPIPTPGAPNSTAPTAGPTAPALVMTPASGFFVGPLTVHLESPVPGSAVYYTLDGVDPTVDGQEYTAPLAVTETTVLRAVALQAGAPVSTVTTATYLVGEPSSLPVLSLVTDPAHLWSAGMGIHTHSAERGREWERPVTVQWLSPAGELDFSVGAGLRIHGGWSRTESAKQSFRLYFRGQYGPRELVYPLFGAAPGQTYDRLVLRGGYNDGWPCNNVPWCQGEVVYVRDQLVRDLHGAMGQVAARGRWVALYLNGVYWGLYNLTERINEAFLARNFDASVWYAYSPSGEVVPGSAYRWNLFADWLTGTDLSTASQYEQAVQQLDIENFTTYFLLNIWAQNQDWPKRNWIVAQPRQGPDRRWRFLVWDAEATFMNTDNTFERVVTDGTQLGQMFASLLQNAQYRTYFAAQVEHHLAGALATESVRRRLTALTAELRPAIAAEATHWYPEPEPAAVEQWEAALQRLSDSLDTSEQRLRYLSDPETLRQQVPPRSVPEVLAPLPPDTRIALLVGFPTVLAKGDAAVVAHLAARGAKVNVIGIDYAGHHDPAQVAASHDLLLISSSIRALDTAARYAQTTTPLIFWAPRLLAATGAPLSPRGGIRSQQTDIRIVDADHPITAGLPVDQPLRVVRRPDTFSVAWPRRGPGVQSLAKHLSGGDYAILVAEAGAELANGQPVQARTVFLYWHHDTFHRGTGEAVRLFDRAVDWTLGLPSG